jgi:2',3'-cyclic-nucleotide 2'-phosphodiesterase (5'-nucleotidase family)
MDKDPKVQLVIDKWDRILKEKVSEIVPNPYSVVFTAEEPLDGLETTIRHRQSNLGYLITSAMLDASAQGAIAGILNSGSIRIDDVLTGDLTAVDIFRILPFGGSIYDVTINGGLLKKMLDYSAAKPGNGAFLQLSNLAKSDGKWIIQGAEVLDTKEYKIVLNDFLLMGYDIPFLNENNPGIIKIDKPESPDDLRTDIRVAIIEYLKS